MKHKKIVSNIENELNQTKQENFNNIEILKKEKNDLNLEKKNIEQEKLVIESKHREELSHLNFETYLNMNEAKIKLEKKISDLKISNYELMNLIDKKDEEIKLLKQDIEMFKLKNKKNKNEKENELNEIKKINKNENKKSEIPMKFGYFSSIKEEQNNIIEKKYKELLYFKLENNKQNKNNILDDKNMSLTNEYNIKNSKLNNILLNKNNKKDKMNSILNNNNLFNLTAKDLNKKQLEKMDKTFTPSKSKNTKVNYFPSVQMKYINN